jgi:hypothetical protein
MILLWKSVSPLCSVAQWQGITLSAEFRDHAWRIALTNAALVPDGGVVKGAWPTQRAAQHEAEMTVERVVAKRAGHVQAHQRGIQVPYDFIPGTVNRSRNPVLRSGGAYIVGRCDEASHAF